MATLVQNARGYEATSDNSFAVSYATNVSAGNLLIVTVGGYHDTATISGVSDSRGTSWTQAGTLLRGTGQRPVPFLAVYYGLAPNSGANTVTVTFSANVADKEIKVWEVAGINSGAPLNATQGASGSVGTGTQVVTTPDITTTAPGFVMKVLQEWSWAGAYEHNIGTPNTGWTEFGETATGSDSAFRIATSSGTFNGAFGFNSPTVNNGYAVRVVAFADAQAVREWFPIMRAARPQHYRVVAFY